MLDCSICDAVTAGVAVAGVAGGAIGFFRAYKQWKHEQHRKRAKSLQHLLLSFESNLLRETICSTDQEDAAKSLFVAAEGDVEARNRLERALDSLSYICYLKKYHLIMDEEFKFFRRQLEKILSDDAVFEYLKQSDDSGDGRFFYLIEYSKSMERNDNDFRDEDGLHSTTVASYGGETSSQSPLSEDDFEEPSIIVRLRNSEGRKPEDAVAGWWKVKYESVKNLKYAIVAIDGIVRGVYSINGWRKYGEDGMLGTANESNDIPSRFQFLGALASQAIADRYMGRSVKSLFKKGAVNPIRYVGPRV